MSCTYCYHNRSAKMLHYEYSMYMNIGQVLPRTTQRRMTLSYDDCHTWSHSQTRIICGLRQANLQQNWSGNKLLQYMLTCFIPLCCTDMLANTNRPGLGTRLMLQRRLKSCNTIVNMTLRGEGVRAMTPILAWTSYMLSATVFKSRYQLLLPWRKERCGGEGVQDLTSWWRLCLKSVPLVVRTSD